MRDGRTDPIRFRSSWKTPGQWPGDYGLMGDHRLLVRRFDSRIDLRASSGGGLADMVFTDPPYNGETTGSLRSF